MSWAIATRSDPVPKTLAAASLVVPVDHAGAAYSSRTGTFHALPDVSPHVAQGEFISLIGLSGRGETMLLRLIADLARPAFGQLSVNSGTPRVDTPEDGLCALAPKLAVGRTRHRIKAMTEAK